MMRVLITGSRDWDDRFFVYRVLNDICYEFDLNYPPDQYGNTLPDPRKITVVHGHCPTGADHWADEWATGCLLVAERHPARWKEFGKMAGYLRNKEMADLGANLCLAFQKDGSRGTQHMINLAKKAGIETRIFRA